MKGNRTTKNPTQSDQADSNFRPACYSTSSGTYLIAIMTSLVRITWVNSLRRGTLQACLGDFDLDITDTVQEKRRRWAQFITQDHKPEVATRLLELQTELEALTRQRSLSPASHAGTEANGTSIDEKRPLRPPTNAATLHVPVTIKASKTKWHRQPTPL
uniref:Uncharacterized protein n=1 Tax=Glossina austeni TaxID=7395 RepID=A0A1A9UNL1_GLOAU